MDIPNTIEIYGRENCAWCKRAIAACIMNNLPYEYLDLTARPELFEDFARRTHGATTVPQILVGEVLIGGHDAFKEAIASTRIQQLIGGR